MRTSYGRCAAKPQGRDQLQDLGIQNWTLTLHHDLYSSAHGQTSSSCGHCEKTYKFYRLCILLDFLTYKLLLLVEIVIVIVLVIVVVAAVVVIIAVLILVVVVVYHFSCNCPAGMAHSVQRRATC
jgi:Flp pilus assembly protein TadB